MVSIEFDEFVSAHTAALIRLAYVLTNDAHRAEDLVQTTLLSAHRQWRKVARADSGEAYVRRMLVNAHLDWHRRRSSSEVPSDVEAGWPTDSSPDPSVAIADRDQLRQLLTTLAPRARAVLVLRYYADMDDHAIGEAMGISPSTVRATAARALSFLRSASQSDVEEKR